MERGSKALARTHAPRALLKLRVEVIADEGAVRFLKLRVEVIAGEGADLRFLKLRVDVIAGEGADLRFEPAAGGEEHLDLLGVGESLPKGEVLDLERDEAPFRQQTRQACLFRGFGLEPEKDRAIALLDIATQHCGAKARI